MILRPDVFISAGAQLNFYLTVLDNPARSDLLQIKPMHYMWRSAADAWYKNLLAILDDSYDNQQHDGFVDARQRLDKMYQFMLSSAT